MNSGDNVLGMSLRECFASSGGKYSSLFMNRGEPTKENSSKRIAMEDSVKMGGYDVIISKPVKNRTGTFQPIAGNSDFWIS